MVHRLTEPDGYSIWLPFTKSPQYTHFWPMLYGHLIGLILLYLLNTRPLIGFGDFRERIIYIYIYLEPGYIVNAA